MARADQTTAASPGFCYIEKQCSCSCPPSFSFTVLPQLKALPRFKGDLRSDQRCGLLFTNSSFRNSSNNLSHLNSSLQPTKLFHIRYGVCFFNVLRATPARKQGVCYDHSLSMGESTAQLRRFNGCAQSWGWSTKTQTQACCLWPHFCTVCTAVLVCLWKRGCCELWVIHRSRRSSGIKNKQNPGRVVG